MNLGELAQNTRIERPQTCGPDATGIRVWRGTLDELLDYAGTRSESRNALSRCARVDQRREQEQKPESI